MMTTTYRTQTPGSKVHVLKVLKGTVWGTRYVAACGAHAYVVDHRQWNEVSCGKCAEKLVQALVAK